MRPLSILKRLYFSLVKGDEFSRYLIAEKVSSLIYPLYKFSEYGRIFLLDKAFIEQYTSISGKENYHSLDRKYTLQQLLKLTYNISGDTAECGAYKGASSYLICQSICSLKKKHHIFDSFQGLSEPLLSDGAYWKKGDLTTNEEKIRHNLSEFNFISYHIGWIPETFGNKEIENKEFSFVHVDVDLYQPTYDSLFFFYNKLSTGGIILCDDYGFIQCPGAKEAVDTFFQDKPEEVIALPTGQAFIIKL